VDKKSTIIDIASKTGYSIATVSRALNNMPIVHDRTKKKIWNIAKKMNYVPNIAAKNLVKGKSRLIGLVLPDDSQIYIDINFHIYQNTLKNNYRLITYKSNNNHATQSFNVEQMLQQQIDGLIFSPIPGDYEVIERIHSFNLPMVIINRFIKNYPVNNIVIDLRQGVSEAVDYLKAAGIQRMIQLVRQDIIRGFERRNVFKFALKANGLDYSDELTYEVDDSFKSGYQKIKEIITSGTPVDAVFCSSDISALGVVRGLLDCGKRVPEDISVVGCYNSELSDYSNPRLSSIGADFAELSMRAVSRLLHLIQTSGTEQNPEPVQNISVGTRFIPRESSR